MTMLGLTGWNVTREGIMRPRPEIERDMKLVVETTGSIQNAQLLEILLDIRDILNRIERDQPLGN